MTAQPWLKFYPTNWRADPALRMCSIAARGLWMEMLCVMHEAAPRGFMIVNGSPVSDRQLAMIAGIDVQEAKALLAELESAGVFSRDEAGAVFSRRMVRDTQKIADAKANGALGGNPDLNRGVNPKDNSDEKPTVTSSNNSTTVTQSEKAEASTRETEFAEAFWPAYPNKVGKPYARRAFTAARRRADLERIMAGLHRYILEKPPDRQWMNPATFLNQDRFDDEPAKPKDANGKPRRTSTAEQAMSAMASALARVNGISQREAESPGAGDGDGSAGGGDTRPRSLAAIPHGHGTG